LQRFATDLPEIRLPLDFPRPPVPGFEGAHVTFELAPEVARQFRALAKSENVTVFMLLLAVYTIFLSRLSGQEDIIVLVPISLRRRAELTDILGIFLNMLPMRNRAVTHVTFSEFLATVKQSSLGAFEHQDYWFDDLVSQLPARIHKDNRWHPVSPVAFDYQNMATAADSPAQNPGTAAIPLQLKRYEGLDNKTTKYDLTLLAFDLTDKIEFSFEYSTRLFMEKTIQRHAAVFKSMIDAIIENPRTRVSDISGTRYLKEVATPVFHQEEDDDGWLD